MVLRLIGAGLPRTGTSSLREALRYLLDAPVYHMSEVLARPEHASTWVEAMQGRPPEWEQFLHGYAAGVDSPFSNCWRQLATAYPAAPVLLSHRGDPAVWYRSMAATVLPRTREMLSKGDADPVTPVFGLIFRGIFENFDDPEEIMAGYERWMADVRTSVEPERLIEWQPHEGWEPICRALGMRVPDLPFPHENSTRDYLARRESRGRRDAARSSEYRA